MEKDKFLFNGNDEKHELDGFVDVADSHQILERFKGAKSGTLLWAAIMALSSAFMTLLFGMEWIYPIFSGFFELLPLSLMSDPFKITGAQILGGLFMVAVFDGASLVSLRALIAGAAQTRKQQDILYTHFWLTFAGSFVASVSYAVLSLNGGLISYNIEGEKVIGGIILAVAMLTFVYDLVTAARFYQESPEVLKSKFEAGEREKSLRRDQERMKAQAELRNRMKQAKFDIEMKIANTALMTANEEAEKEAQGIGQSMGKAAARQFNESYGITAVIPQPAPQPPAPQIPAPKPITTTPAPAPQSTPMAFTSPPNNILMIDTQTGDPISPQDEGENAQDSVNFTPPPTQ